MKLLNGYKSILAAVLIVTTLSSCNMEDYGKEREEKRTEKTTEIKRTDRGGTERNGTIQEERTRTETNR